MNKKVRGIIIEDNKILLIHRIKEDENYWVFPGGSVEEYDSSLEDALKREMKEELGVEIKIRDLYDTNDFEGKIEYFYFCEIIGGELGTGGGPEFQENSGYIGEYILEWVNLKDLKNKNIFPKTIRDKIFKDYEK